MIYQLIVYVPKSHAEILKNALFNAGAGQYANYDQCAWECEGTGQFRPLDNANPYIGTIRQQEKIPEIKIEMICRDVVIKEVLHLLKEIHPYEEPAYGVTVLKTIEDFV